MYCSNVLSVSHWCWCRCSRRPGHQSLCYSKSCVRNRCVLNWVDAWERLNTQQAFPKKGFATDVCENLITQPMCPKKIWLPMCSKMHWLSVYAKISVRNWRVLTCTDVCEKLSTQPMCLKMVSLTVYTNKCITQPVRLKIVWQPMRAKDCVRNRCVLKCIFVCEKLCTQMM